MLFLANSDFCLLACITVLYPVYKMKKDLKFEKLTHHLITLDTQIMHGSNLDLQIIATKPEQYETWLKYVSQQSTKDGQNIDYYDTFAQHLIRHVCSYILLFVTF